MPAWRTPGVGCPSLFRGDSFFRELLRRLLIPSSSSWASSVLEGVGKAPLVLGEQPVGLQGFGPDPTGPRPDIYDSVGRTVPFGTGPAPDLKVVGDAQDGALVHDPFPCLSEPADRSG
jgi:hypothetical protein